MKMSLCHQNPSIPKAIFAKFLIVKIVTVTYYCGANGNGTWSILPDEMRISDIKEKGRGSIPAPCPDMR
jgi:hypothetical protein